MVYKNEEMADEEGNNDVVAQLLTSKKDYVNTDRDLRLFLWAMEEELTEFLDEEDKGVFQAQTQWDHVSVTTQF